MVNADVGYSPAERDPFGHGKPHQEGAHQARTARHRDAIQILQLDPRFFESPINDRKDVAHVLTGSQLRHDAAIGAVDSILGRDDAGKNRAAVEQHCRCRVITRGLYTQN